jgi:hypothetical protein
MSGNQPQQGLPDVSDETLAGIEDRVFRAIAEERRSRPAPGRRRLRVWQGVGVAAAIVAVAAVISPVVLQSMGAGGGASSAGGAAESAPDMGTRGAAEDAPTVGQAPDEALGGDGDQSGDPLAERELVRTGSASIVVDDPASAADAIVRLAAQHGGWVEQLSLGADGSQGTVDPADPTGGTVWVPEDGGFVTIRVPADDLDGVMAALDDVGEVSSTRVGTQDVTAQAVDLRARVDAARASVDRLTELLAQSGSVRDLVEVESTLSQRQAELESLEQQLEALEGQVAMSSLSISLLREAPAVEPDPAGFGDGLEAGWNGLLATLNGVVVALGFLLPWLGLLAVVLALIWAARRGAARRRRARDTGQSGV